MSLVLADEVPGAEDIGKVGEVTDADPKVLVDVERGERLEVK